MLNIKHFDPEFRKVTGIVLVFLSLGLLPQTFKLLNHTFSRFDYTKLATYQQSAFTIKGAIGLLILLVSLFLIFAGYKLLKPTRENNQT